ncbi:hypothetical protein GGI21_004297 [Coemansia aciculifera]|nr:hypothetical protein GGI21_004297 [Coemansia aciculifera]
MQYANIMTTMLRCRHLRPSLVSHQPISTSRRRSCLHSSMPIAMHLSLQRRRMLMDKYSTSRVLRPWCTPTRLGPMAATLHYPSTSTSISTSTTSTSTQPQCMTTWYITLKSTSNKYHSTSNNTMRRCRHSSHRSFSHHRPSITVVPLLILSQRLGTTSKSRCELGHRHSTRRLTNSSSNSNSNNASNSNKRTYSSSSSSS